MKITPLDVQQKQFQRTTWKGYNPEEVHHFLDMVRSELESVLRENSTLKEHLKKSEVALDDFREREKALKDTLIMAQKITEGIKAGALKEAEIVMSEARLQGEQIVESAHARLSQIVDEIQDLKGQRTQMIASLRATIETHSKLLEITERQMEKREAIEDRLPSIKGGRALAEMRTRS